MVGVEALRAGDGGVDGGVDEATARVGEELLLSGSDAERAD